MMGKIVDTFNETSQENVQKTETTDKDIRAHFRLLDHKEKTEIRVFSENYPQGKSVFVKDEDKFVEEVKNFNQDDNVYVGYSERENEGKDDKSVISKKFIILDLDFHDRPIDKQKADDVCDFLIKNNMAYSHLIFTGGGFQFYLPIKEIKDKQKIKDICDKAKFFFTKQHDLNLDPSVFNPSRVIRVFGTHNHKWKKDVKIVDVQNIDAPMLQMNFDVIDKVVITEDNKIIFDNHSFSKVPKICNFIEETACKIKLPSGTVTRHDYLDGNVWQYCTQNGRSEILEKYMQQQNRNSSAFNGCEKWRFDCNTIRKYCKENGLDDCKCQEYESMPKDIWLEEKDKKGKISKKLIHKNVVHNLMLENSFITLGDKKFETYLYDNGAYVVGGEKFIAKEVEAMTESNVKQHDINEIIGHIQRLTFKEYCDVNKDENLICVNNGILDLNTNNLSSHTPAKVFLHKIPHNFNTKADCKKFKAFLKSILDDQSIIIIQEFLGFLLYRPYFIKKALIFLGEPDTGKTTLLKIIINFIGEKNVSSVSLHSLTSNKFAASTLFGKLMNFYDDLDVKDIKSVGVFKIATGTGYIAAEKKFGDQFTFKNEAKHVFATNKMSSPADLDDDAYYIRWIILIFNKIIPKEKQNPFIDKEIIEDKKEIEGILNFALEGLKRLKEQNNFSYDKTADDIRTIMERNASPVERFIQDCLEKSEGSWISKEDLYQIYSTYCSDFSIPRFTKTKFSQELIKRKKEFVESRKDCLDKKSVTGWLNLKLNKSFNGFFELKISKYNITHIPKDKDNFSLKDYVK